MKAIILCAGYATRMYPLTETKAKSLLLVWGKPILNHIIEKIPSDMKEIIVEGYDLSKQNFKGMTPEQYLNLMKF